MARLIYSMFMSLDGYIADRNGGFDWAEPDEEVHTFVNQLGPPAPSQSGGGAEARRDQTRTRTAASQQ